MEDVGVMHRFIHIIHRKREKWTPYFSNIVDKNVDKMKCSSKNRLLQNDKTGTCFLARCLFHITLVMIGTASIGALFPEPLAAQV